MKPYQRSFVVEIKSTRRRSKMPTKSIWGDTDIKALAREAEAAHLSAQAAVSDPLGQLVDRPSTPEPMAEPAKVAEIPDPNPLPGLFAEANPVHSEPADQALTERAPVEKEMDALVRPFPDPVKIRRPRKVKAPADGESIRLDATGSDRDLPQRDELALLEEENRYLKLRLAEQLHQQNLDLRKKLERFGTR